VLKRSYDKIANIRNILIKEKVIKEKEKWKTMPAD